MDCNRCKQEMADMFDSDVDQAEFASLKNHLLQCPECASEYREISELMSMLKPKTQLNAPFLLKQNIIHQVNMEENKMKRLKMIKLSSKAKRVISIAAVITIIMVIVPFFGSNIGFMNSTAKAANSLIESSIKATSLIKSMIIKLKVRTIAHDNFALVGTGYDMVDHTLYKSFEKPEKWRIDKGERVVVFDGKNQFLWIPKLEEGIKAGSDANFTEWLKILLDPESILLKEKANAKDKDSKCTMSEIGDEVHLTITSKAQGNFINDYCKNKSIIESDNRREYIFDNKTKLLKSLKIYILQGEKETLILETENIAYNEPVNSSLFSITLPEGMVWHEIAVDPKNGTFSNITSKHAAELIFDAMSKNNWDAIKDVWQLSSRVTMSLLKNEYGGLEVIKIGEPFKSGLHKCEFVPYEVKLPDGSIRKHNIALRNDNRNKVWVVDGGL